MAFNFAFNPNLELPKIYKRLPRIRVKTDIPKIILEESNETLFFNLDLED